MISLLIFLPLVGALVAAFSRHAALSRWLTLAVSGVATLVSLGLWLGYDLVAGGFQYLQAYDWIPSVGIRYVVGLDGLSLPFVFLTALLTFVATLTEWKRTDSGFFALFLLLQAALTAVFTALDLVLFFVAFELVLIPMFFIIGVWGYDRRRYAAVKFLLYSLVGSVFLFVALLAAGFVAAEGGVVSFDYRDLVGNAALAANTTTALLICLGFIVAFLIKLPAFPLHTWLPHAHTQAPTAGSILLAGVLLKMGGYGMIRFNIALFPDAMLTLQPLLATLAVVGILYGGFVALGQTDLKQLIAYSSVNHMGFTLLGIASLTAFGVHGAVYQMVAHGVITGLLFMLVGMLSVRTHTRTIAALTGMYTAMPVLGGLLWLAMLGGAGMPGLAGFVGEFQALLGAFQNPATTAFAAAAVIGILVNGALMLWTIQRVLQGEPTTQMRENYDLEDLGGLELAAAAPLVFLALLWGLWPPSLTPFIDAGVQPALQAIANVSDLAGDLAGKVTGF
ncbi:MAG: NADH-quinone oxidoreductase subunit M [Trueperaceae bacterium]|nr:NADH-quinone oxidoreductase subunit M [Trueperaceae bacterium]